MDIPRPDHFNEVYLYEGKEICIVIHTVWVLTTGQNLWSVILLPLSAPDSP